LPTFVLVSKVNTLFLTYLHNLLIELLRLLGHVVFVRIIQSKRWVREGCGLLVANEWIVDLELDADVLQLSLQRFTFRVFVVNRANTLQQKQVLQVFLLRIFEECVEVKLSLKEQILSLNPKSSVNLLQLELDSMSAGCEVLVCVKNHKGGLNLPLCLSGRFLGVLIDLFTCANKVEYRVVGFIRFQFCQLRNSFLNLDNVHSPSVLFMSFNHIYRTYLSEHV
jgi:hypothetical protein